MIVGGIHFTSGGYNVWTSDDESIRLFQTADGQQWAGEYDRDEVYADTGFHREPALALIQLRENLREACTFFDTLSSLPDVSGRTSAGAP